MYGDIIKSSTKEFPIQATNLQLIVVYRKPLDYPEKIVARLWDLTSPTPFVVLKDSLEDLQRDIRRYRYWMIPMGPRPEDDPCIVETYI